MVDLAMPGEERIGYPVELLAWGRFNELRGLGLGIAVGESMLLVLSTWLEQGGVRHLGRRSCDQ